MQNKGIILQLQEDNKALQEQLNRANDKVNHLADRVTEIHCKISLKDELVRGLFDKKIQDMKRKGHAYKKGTEEHKLYLLLVDKLIDVKQEINSSIK